MGSSFPDVKTVVDEAFPHALSELCRLVRIPSVSWPSFGPENVVQSAQEIAQLAQGTGLFEKVEVLRSLTSDGETLGQPAVVARRNATAGMPTILLYAHHDVQPPGDSSLWLSSAFEPVERDGRLYGRGAADDKAGIMSHITALQLLPTIVDSLEVGIVLFIEGEEEFGSPSFDRFLVDHHDMLDADVIVVADSGNWDTTTPALTTSLRGNVTFQLTVRTLDHALHSGMFGGLVPDAFLALTKIVNSFYSESGTIAVTGLLHTAPETPEFSEERVREESGLLSHVTTIGEGSFLNRLWHQPSITITGLDMPDLAHASNTLIPSVTARVSVRVAPGQSAEEAFNAVSQHINQHAPFGVLAEFSEVRLGEPFTADATGWASRAYATALSEVWDTSPVEMGVGGSIPFINSFVSSFPDAQVLVTGVEDPDSRAHSPNESLHIDSYKKAIEAELRFLVTCNSFSN
ncbi:acetylornithine deacetylase/succinyl-diaminopimelate desuccinylase-like protein [Aurantimicrobium minutum]|uniref:M20/M25/M40 family metallo-hydrolase n=1 Tax=Aurantimicrobium minutum TaxID=708131 RepID=UPI002473EE7B|nr:M20/M25/M40 family metallo-hydrolase [Aurantimicrobium minutum]MDH6532930.1 acetylornithine deacetylase/succinyl-diaminopimelate desuccinylase-like protein [Aurantimicrobium minutum]